ncbi:sec14 cytosolic [Plasmopara halstedii]|uniref:Sec14 cytosolic n=1 Tax=Plasmopara halstedii TaxID=4781 RepID=A0A0P1ALM7_PLAHL|nr:sec14 cytosolic [Plasmopara halstedii]CEG41519.1 sec14 cytosolic [Plasmopara halstedii]|eukprot:XP_024577888.1 sec14 cytosolic [Plasmopara halstedii]
MSSSSGSLTTQLLQGYRTVSLPGLFPVEEHELFGKERGQVLLSDIGYSKVVMPEDAPSGAEESGHSSFFVAVLSKRKTLLLFLRADSLEYASSWTSIINNAVHTGKSVHFAPRWTVETMQSFISVASGNFADAAVHKVTEIPIDVAAAPTMTRPAPKVLVVSVVSGSLNGPNISEKVVKRNVEIEVEFLLGSFGQKDTCVVTLSDGEEVYISRRMLGNDLQSLLTSPKQIELTTPTRSQPLRPHIVSISKVFVSFRCIVAPPVQMPRRDSGPQPVIPSLPSTFTVAFPGTLGGLFLLSCLISLYCAIPFVGLMKITMVLGMILSVSQITQFVFCLTETQSRMRSGSVLTPVRGPKKSIVKAENDLMVYFTVDKIEVVEADQETEPVLSDKTYLESEASNDAECSSISGGPIAFSPRFIAGEKGDEEKGRARYLATLKWRKENNIDNILVTPHPNFEIIKRSYPQYFHGRTRDGHPVYYERPGKIDLPALKREGLSIDDLLRHYMYITEYLWRVVEPNDLGRSITVLDVSGIGMYDLGGEVLDFIKRASAFTGEHYPERSAHIFIINIPGWFNMIWRMVKPMIDPVTREKVHMLKGSAILKELETLIDLENIPSDFGGESVALGDSEEEHALAAHVKKYLGVLNFT